MSNARNRLWHIKGLYVYYYSVYFETVPLMTTKTQNAVSHIKFITLLFVADEEIKNGQTHIFYR